jgi:hypothetical protein
MSIRDLNWIRRRTTVEDLLDDGIENASDLGKASSDASLPSDPGVRAEQAAELSAKRRKSFSVLGVFLGLLIAAGGCIFGDIPS